MKKELDDGLKYIFELGLERIRGKFEYQRYLKTKLGNEKADTIIKYMSDRADNQSYSFTDDKFYALKNESLETALAVESCINTDYIRKAANWINGHKELFGKRIADIGCDTGILTCFIAKCCPESHIVGIDRGENGISVAKALAAKLNIQNIEFRVGTFAEESEHFDTVFSSKTIHENLDKDGGYERKLCDAFGFTDHAHLFDGATERYYGDIKKLLNPSGFFVSIEWPHRNSFALHMLQSLNKNGLVPQREYLDSLETETGDGITSLSVFVSACMQGVPEPDVNRMFFDRYFPETVVGLNRYGAWNGQSLLYVKEKLYHEERISFVTGIHMYLHGERYGRISLWEDTANSSVCYIEQIQNEPGDCFSKIDRASFESFKKQLDDSPKGKDCGDPYTLLFSVNNGQEKES